MYVSRIWLFGAKNLFGSVLVCVVQLQWEWIKCCWTIKQPCIWQDRKDGHRRKNISSKSEKSDKIIILWTGNSYHLCIISDINMIYSQLGVISLAYHWFFARLTQGFRIDLVFLARDWSRVRSRWWRPCWISLIFKSTCYVWGIQGEHAKAHIITLTNLPLTSIKTTWLMRENVDSQQAFLRWIEPDEVIVKCSCFFSDWNWKASPKEQIGLEKRRICWGSSISDTVDAIPIGQHHSAWKWHTPVSEVHVRLYFIDHNFGLNLTFATARTFSHTNYSSTQTVSLSMVQTAKFEFGRA